MVADRGLVIVRGRRCSSDARVFVTKTYRRRVHQLRKKFVASVISLHFSSVCLCHPAPPFALSIHLRFNILLAHHRPPSPLPQSTIPPPQSHHSAAHQSCLSRAANIRFPQPSNSHHCAPPLAPTPPPLRALPHKQSQPQRLGAKERKPSAVRTCLRLASWARRAVQSSPRVQ